MGLLQKLKSTLGFGGSRSRRGGERTDEVDVTVEHEPNATSEAAVKGSNGGWEDETAVAETAAGEAEGARAVETDGEATADEAAGAGSESIGGEGAAGTDDEGVPVDELSGIGPAYAERLGNAGVETVADLANAEAATVAEDSDIARGRIESWVEQAREY